MKREVILSQLVKYSTSELSLAKFEEWIVGRLQKALDSGNEEVVRLFNEVDALFLELGEQLIDEKLFMERVVSILQNAETVHLANQASIRVKLSGCANSLSRTADFTEQNAEIRLQHAFA